MEVHPHWTWLRIQTNATGKTETFMAKPAYEVVVLEVTAEGKKEVRFKVDSEENVKEVERDGTTVKIE